MVIRGPVCWLPCSASVRVLATSLILNGRACLRSGEGGTGCVHHTPEREFRGHSSVHYHFIA